MRHVDGQQGRLTIERMCALAVVSRAGYYRFCQPMPEADEEESKLRDAIQRTAIGSRQYGYRRVTRALRDQGWEVNHKRVARLMREDGLLAIRKRRFIPQTTDSEHELEVAVNVAHRLTATAINQLWVADITYVRLGRADVFLAVIMDAFSRKIVGWNLAPKLTTELPLAALS
ncbi:MAG: IS3 family transposase [Acidobacteriaceae bacterium]|nr:IS3 family transposase [Acidobacteriaceae bacterium]